jgi:SsrA-binding protein
LLLHKKEILELWDKVRIKGHTIIPLRVYLSQGKAKVEIAVARGKKLRDKRKDIAERDAERQAERDLKGIGY